MGAGVMSFYDHFSEHEQKELYLRAERAASSDRDTLDTVAVMDALGVRLGDETYALPLHSLTAAYQVDVNLTTPIVAVPCTPPFVAGIVNIRGHVVPVFDLAVLLGMAPDTTAESEVFVMVTNEDLTVALRVTTISGTLAVRLDELTPLSGLFGLAEADYLQGTLPDGTILVDVDAILNDPALIVDEVVN
jgi:purine-binding chemotaxis protein CheW